MNTTATLVLPLLAAFHVGCVSSTDESTTVPDAAHGDLELDVNTADHVEGRFASEGSELLFELDRDGFDRHVQILSGAGRPLLDATLHEGVETASLLGGRLVVTGEVSSASPSYAGDMAVLDELSTLPEVPLVGPLKDALADAGVESSLFRYVTQDSSIETWGLIPTWVTLDARQAIQIPTWSFWGTTTILLRNISPVQVLYPSITTYNGVRATYPVFTGSTYTVQGQWWGAPVTVRNEIIWVGNYLQVYAY